MDANFIFDSNIIDSNAIMQTTQTGNITLSVNNLSNSISNSNLISDTIALALTVVNKLISLMIEVFNSDVRIVVIILLVAYGILRIFFHSNNLISFESFVSLLLSVVLFPLWAGIIIPFIFKTIGWG